MPLRKYGRGQKYKIQMVMNKGRRDYRVAPKVIISRHRYRRFIVPNRRYGGGG